MFKKLSDKQRKRLHRKIHIRKSIYGTAERPRMSVYKSGHNLYVQVINDDEGRTLASISTLEIRSTTPDHGGINPLFG